MRMLVRQTHPSFQLVGGLTVIAHGFPTTLIEFDRRFATEEACRDYLMHVRWPDGWRCPRCAHDKAWHTARQVLHCAACGHQSSLTAGTVMHSTKKPLMLWFKAMFLMATQKSGVSATTLQEHLGLSAPTAWTWLHKLRQVMVVPGRKPLRGRVEIDDTYIGKAQGRGRRKGKRSLVVIAVEDRGSTMGRARMQAVADASGESFMAVVQTAVAKGSRVHTDGWDGYREVSAQGYKHERDVLNSEPTQPARHAKAAAVFPNVHQLATLLKRWLLGTHQGAVREKHVQAYLDEFVFRFNRRRAWRRSWLFERLAQLAMSRQAEPYWRIVGRDSPDQPLHLAVT